MISDNAKRLLNNYLRKLTNLSGNNRSIFLPRLLADRHLDLQSLSQFNKEPAFKIIESLLAGTSKVVCSQIDARLADANESSYRLKKLQRIETSLVEETGSNDLHIGWPLVRGKFLDGTCVRCPLLFIPVSLQIENEQWTIVPREEEICFNKSFLLAYAFYNQVPFNDELLEETFEETERDSTIFRTAIYQLLQKAKIEVHFNADNYRDELIAFRNFTKEEFENEHEPGKLKLYPEAVMGIFSQTGSQLVPDYEHLLRDDLFHDVENFFIERSKPTTSTNFLSQVKEDKVYSILSMDAWQENAIKGVKLGQSLVVQGPPGTGKSQLICNLVSDAIASGKRILVVCQKRAALDVVYSRMKEQKLEDFLALVHDFRHDRKEIFEKIAQQIASIEEYKSKNISLDSIQLNRKFLQASHRIDQLSEELEHYRQILFDDSECGCSVKQLYLTSNPKQPHVNLKLEYSGYNFQSLGDTLRRLKQYCFYALQFAPSQYPWSNRKSFAKLLPSDLHKIKEILNEIPSYLSFLQREFLKLSNTTLDWEQCEALAEQTTQADSILSILNSPTRYQAFKQMISEPDDETGLLWAANSERVLLECFDGDGVEKVIATAQLGQFQKALERSRRARKNIFGLLIWELFSKDKLLVTRALVGNGLKNNRKDFKTLERKLDNRLNLVHNLSKLKAKSWLDVPDSIDREVYAKWFNDLQKVIKSKLAFNSIRGIKNLISVQSSSHQEFSNKFGQVFQIVKELPSKRNYWLQYFLGTQINFLNLHPNSSNLMVETLTKDFDALVEFDKLVESLTTSELEIFSKLQSVSKSWEHATNEKIFLNSLSLAWIDHIELKHPELRMVSSGKMEMIANELREQIQQKQAVAREIVLLRAREKVTDDLEFNRLNNRVTYRDLLHQVTKKRKVWPLRKVMQEFEDDVFKLLPCWLASPESVSAIFSMKEIFDLVVFDEASQCFAERGIPALYRGKQALIAGDSKQLKPGDFYMARWNDDDDHPDQEVDSLLALAERFLNTVSLLQHYRSESVELIKFSNQHFYDRQLTMTPSREVINGNVRPLEYWKVDGIWESNKNITEAQKVAEWILQHSQQNPNDSVGVITFNAPQQDCVLDELENLFKQHRKPIPQNLFVKNIENVQGDERDIIIFSIGYAPDEKGKMTAQFGSLNVDGGENRLNVAITRARKKIIVVASIDPEQLNVANTKNDGPKLLKRYLEFVKRDAAEISFENDSLNHVSELKQAMIPMKVPAVELVASQIPSHDLTIKKNGLFASAVLTDDEQYHRAPSAKYWHTELPKLLEQKHWPVGVFYSRNYWFDVERFQLEFEKWQSR